MDTSLPRVAVMLFGLLLPIQAICDEVFMKNGDRLTGNVVRKSDNILILKTSYAGEIEIQWSDVSHLVTEQPVHIVLDDDTEMRGHLNAYGDSKLKIEMIESKESAFLSVEKIAAINPQQKHDFTFSGQVNVGVEIDRGNSDEGNYYIGSETEFRWPSDRLTLELEVDIETTERTTTDQEVDFQGDFDHFISERWYTTSGLLFEHDKFDDLSSRITVSTGFGYDIIKTKRTNLSLEGSPGYLWENFRESSDANYPVGIVALNFNHYLFKSLDLQVFHEHRYTQSLEDNSDYIFLSSTGLRLPIAENFQITFQYNYDRDNAPGDDVKKDDHESLLTIGYDW